MVPLCVHIPTVVPAGGSFPVAIYGEAGCDTFDYIEVTANGAGDEYNITVWGLSDLLGVCTPYEVCTLEQWTYSGLVLLDAPNPGAYKVTVADKWSKMVGATGGLIDEPECQEDCAAPELSAWDWTFLKLSPDDVVGECFTDESEGYMGTPIEFSGLCQEFTVVSDDWDYPAQAYHCGDGHILFGTEAPYWAEATVCDGNPSVQPAYKVVLGAAQGVLDPDLGPQMFVFKGTSKDN